MHVCVDLNIIYTVSQLSVVASVIRMVLFNRPVWNNSIYTQTCRDTVSFIDTSRRLHLNGTGVTY